MTQRIHVEWPTCAVDGCIGISLTPGQPCLAHGSEEETAAALKLIGETGVIDARGVSITEDLLERVLAAAPRGEDGKPSLQGSRFDWATFSGDAEFDEVTFSGDAVFDGATFEGSAEFGDATFTGNAQFFQAAFVGGARFDGATFTGGAGFIRAIFRGGDQFPGGSFVVATFKGVCWFTGATLSGGADFSGATFESMVALNGATFTGAASFSGAKFRAGAAFGSVTFRGAAQFDDATFEAGAEFEGVTFRDAEFRGVTFERSPDFHGATFKGRAHFARAIFRGSEPLFPQVTFKGVARFGDASFEQTRRFGPLLAHRGLVLDGVHFMQPVAIEASTIGLCCRKARFLGGVQFRLRWAAVVLDDTDLAAPSWLGACYWTAPEQFQWERQIATAWVRLLGNELHQYPQLLSLRGANVAGLGLSDVSLSDCRFERAHNLDKLRLESKIAFATAPPPLGLGAFSLGWRLVIAEECDWRAQRFHPHRWVSPFWPRWLDEDRPYPLGVGQVAELYRALRKGREDNKDEPGAADFYYGEMEMRRHTRSFIPSRDAGERAILTAYWLVSGYGLRAWRAVAWLAVITAILALAFHLVGFTVPPQPASYWTSLLYAFRATLSLTDSEVKLTAWGELLQAVLRLTGPVLLGLALLALRGRVKR